ncbi:MAG: tetratricopeptide repeat protein, partial [Planctomycetes bacterium]|nr:tetratricopeptide repeat protein [Planctomycetota bacterium]
ALAQDLRRFARGDPIEARPQSPLERLARRARRHAVKLGVLLLALILLAVSGLLLHQYRINQAEAKAAEERAAIDEYRRAVTLAVSRIQVGEMGIHVTESRESGMDPNGLFPAMRLESLVGERTREPLDAAVAELEAAIAHLPAGTDGHEALYHLARALKLRGDLEEAAEKLDELKRVRPRFVAATILRAEIERRLGREEEAASLEEAAVTEALVSDAPWVRFWLEARRAERDRRWPDAVKAYGHLMDSTGAGKPPYEGFGLESRLRRGLAHLEAGELAAAAADFAVARHDWPDAIEPRLLLGRTLHVQGSKEEAKRIFQELYESQPPDQRDLAVVWVILTYSYEDEWADALEWAEKLSQEIHRERVRGFYLSGLNRPEEAEKVAREIIAKRPDDAIAHHVLALSLRAQKEFEAAIESCEKSISLDPENFASHATLARIIEETGHPRESIEHLRRAMELEPRSALVLSNLGSMLVRMARDEEERDEGEKLLLESYNIRPTAVACTFLAVLLELKKPPGFAQRKVELLEEAIELGPNYWIAWYQLGLELCLRQGNTFDGIEKLLRAAVLRPQAHQIHQSLGYAYERLGLRDDAIDHYNQAAELVHQEGIDEAIQLSGIVRLGSALARESDIPEVRERGIALLKEAAEDPRCEKMSPVLLEYATALLDNHKDEEALEAVQRAREVDPRHPLTLVNLAVCHGRLGKPEEALGELLAAFELGRGQYFPNIAEYTIRLFQEHRNAEFGEALERLRQGLEVEMARGTVEAGAAWNLWVMIQLWLERLSIEEVLAAVDELAARAPADTGDELKACAADVRWALERIKEDGAIRINCGGDAHRDSGAGGVAWGKDRFAQSGSEVDLREIANEKNYYLPPIAACDDQTIYLTQRCFGGDAAIRGYRVPVPPGDYRVTLHFVEMTPVPTLGLVFGIQLEGEMVAERFKPQRGGVAAAVRETFEVKGADALLEIFFKPVRGSPQVCAIEIERVAPTDNR